jgi:hypothetical protein
MAPLRWYHAGNTCVRKERTFHVARTKQADIVAGFRKAEALFGKGTIYTISLTRLSPATNISTTVEKQSDIPSQAKHSVTLVNNGTFDNEMAHWNAWRCSPEDFLRHVKVINTVVNGNRKKAVRIENDTAALIGLQQNVNVISGTVYALSGMARSTTATGSFSLFGGRIGFWLPPQEEKQVLWMKENTAWTRRSTTFTNMVSGTATLFVHMGYGNIASTGEFTDIRLEMIE